MTLHISNKIWNKLYCNNVMNPLPCPQRFYREFQFEVVKKRKQGEGWASEELHCKPPKRWELYKICWWVWVHLEGTPAMLLSSSWRQKLLCSWGRLSRFCRVKSLKSIHKFLIAVINCWKTQLFGSLSFFVQMVSALRAEFLPALFSQMQI